MSTDIVPWLPGIATGLCIAVLVWQCDHWLAKVPAEDRQFMDRPAVGFRVVWPLIRIIAFYSESCLRPSTAHRLKEQLNSAGLTYTLSAAEFNAARWVSAGLFAVVVFVLTIAYTFNTLWLVLLSAVGGFYYPLWWLRGVAERRRQNILRTLPFYLDVLTLSVEAGSNLTGGLTQAVQKSADSPLRREISRVLRDIRAGKTRADALRDMAERTASPALQQVVSGLIQAERSGSGLGPLLRAQSQQLRSERFQRAEKQAMQAPVKMLLPLVVFIFPTTFLVLVFSGAE